MIICDLHTHSTASDGQYPPAELARLAPFTASYPVSEETVWYLCENGACRAPVRRFEELGL